MDASVSQTITPFTYDTLPDAAKYIRLLEVLDDMYSNEIRIRCRITTWPVDNTPSYYAISYTWGDPEPGSTILVNGQVFQITTNCEFVLKQAYWFKKTSYYWVDAICINQRHLEEKSLQVSMMGNIYKQAAQVLACVGDHADDSAFLIHKLKNHAFTRITLFGKMLHGDDFAAAPSLRFQLGQRLSTNIRFLHAVFCFLERPYFTRLWVLQELKNAREATFLCGQDAVQRHFMHQMLDWLNYKLGWPHSLRRDSALAAIARRTLVVRRLYFMKVYEKNNYDPHTPSRSIRKISRRAWFLVASNYDIYMLLMATRGLECQERKDKIFGLISLIDWGISGPLIPDYTQNEFEVAVGFLKALLNAWYQGGIRPHENIPDISRQVMFMLRLDPNSPGVHSAIEARRMESETWPANEKMSLEHINSDHSVWPGWRVSSGHLTKSESGFSTWRLSESALGKVYLPFWVQGDDWIVMTGKDLVPSVLVREVVGGLGGPLIGHVYTSDEFHTKQAPVVSFRIHWDPEDLVISAIVETQCVLEREYFLPRLGRIELSSRPRWNHTELRRALNTAICRKETPGSSYALRCD